MIRKQRARITFGAGLAVAMALPALTAALPPAQAATATGWRIVSNLHAGPATNFDGLTSVVAPGKTDAWAFGGSDLGEQTGGAPIAEHWNGRHWRAAALPGGLTDALGAASAPSGNDVWVVSQLGGYVLHYNGSKWSVAKTWPEGSELPQALTGVTALSPTNVWVFGGSGAFPGLGTWHLHGRTWTKVTGTGADISEASALSSRNIWATGGNSAASEDIVEHYNGSTWRQEKGAALDNVTFNGIVALSPSSVWVSGSDTENGNVSRLLHWNGKTWAQVKIPYPVGPEAIASDGHGGIWLSAISPATRDWYALHRSAAGKWQRSLLTETGQAPGLALITGSTSVWGAGAVPTVSGGNAVIWAYGAIP
jgi:hypothetical protein